MKKWTIKKLTKFGSSQDGGIDRNASLPCTTKRITTNFLKNEQPEMPENQTVWNSDNKELKKHSPKPVGGVEMGDRQPSGEDEWQVGRPCRRGGLAEQETKDSKAAVKYCRCCHCKRNSQSHRRVYLKEGLEWSKPVALFPL